MRIKTHRTPKLLGLVLALGIMIAGGFYVSQNVKAATMTDYNIAKTDPLNLAYHMDEPLYTVIYSTYNTSGSPRLDADQDGTITLTEAGSWGGAYLTLSNQGITGTMRGIEHFTNITTLGLNNNQLTGEIPTNIGNMTKLTTIYLYVNQLSGEIPNSIGNLANLSSLHLATNQLSGSIPNSIDNLTNLTSLYLYTNQLTGSIPSSIGSLTNLTVLNLYNNRLSGSIPSSVGNLTNLTSLQLHNNQLTGIIPSSIGNLTDLTTLSLHTNQLTGMIPDSIGNLTDLTTLSLYNNQLTGSIPVTIGDLASLTSLQLHNNQLTGQIPSSIGNLTDLTILNLSNNHLTGSIPDSIGGLANLANLHLYTNWLTGAVPASFANLSSLTSMNLGANNLSGTLPDIAVGSPGANVVVVFNKDLITPDCASIPSNYSIFANYHTAAGNEECSIDSPSTSGNYATVNPQDGSLIILRQDVDGDGRADINLQSTNLLPNQNIDVNGDNVADINIIVFPEHRNTPIFNAGTAITISDGFAGWIPANMSLGAGTWTKADFRVSPNYPYYLEAVTPGALVMNANPAPVILTITKCGTNNDVNGDGVPDYNIDINNDGIVDYRPFNICPATIVPSDQVSVPNAGLHNDPSSNKIAILLLGAILAGALFLAMLIGRKLIVKEIK